MTHTVFYSWQSDTPNSTNRGFIEKALRNATKSIGDDDSIEVEPVVDRDTLGVPGSPDIAETILDKIDRSQVFVCDVSIINQNDTSRPTPNPNVLVELGYALKALGWSQIIMVMNTAFGNFELLPFDLRMKRVVTYHMLEETQDRSTERKKLSSMLEASLRVVLRESKKLTEEFDFDPLRVDFQKVEASMPNLITEMREDLTREGGEFVREFFVISKGWIMNYGKTPRFVYHYEEHDNLDGKIQVLENYGFVFDVTTTNAKKYRMTEEFVGLLVSTQ